MCRVLSADVCCLNGLWASAFARAREKHGLAGRSYDLSRETRLLRSLPGDETALPPGVLAPFRSVLATTPSGLWTATARRSRQSCLRPAQDRPPRRADRVARGARLGDERVHRNRRPAHRSRLSRHRRYAQDSLVSAGQLDLGTGSEAEQLDLHRRAEIGLPAAARRTVASGAGRKRSCLYRPWIRRGRCTRQANDLSRPHRSRAQHRPDWRRRPAPGRRRRALRRQAPLFTCARPIPRRA